MNWSPNEAHNTKEKFSVPVKLTRNNMFNRVIQVRRQKALSIGNSIVKHFSMSLVIFVLYSSFCRRNKHLGLQLSSQFQMKTLKCWHVCRMDNLILIHLPLIYFPQTLWFVWVFSKFTTWMLIFPQFTFLTHQWGHLTLLFPVWRWGWAKPSFCSQKRERGELKRAIHRSWFYQLPLTVPQGMIPIVPGEQGLNAGGSNTRNSQRIHKADKVITHSHGAKGWHFPWLRHGQLTYHMVSEAVCAIIWKSDKKRKEGTPALSSCHIK